MAQSYSYKGHRIYECEMADPREHGGRWMVQTYHHTGTPWACSECPHFRTLAAARAYIVHEMLSA